MVVIFSTLISVHLLVCGCLGSCALLCCLRFMYLVLLLWLLGHVSDCFVLVYVFGCLVFWVISSGLR